MPNMQMNDLVDIASMWGDVEEPQSYENLPDGNYNFVVEVARAEYTNNNQRCLYWELVVADGPLQGRKQFKRHFFEEAWQVGLCKSELRIAGIDVDSPTFDPVRFMVNETGLLIGRVINATLQTKTNKENKTYQNCIFKHLVEDQPATAQPPAAQPPRVTPPAGRTAAQPGRMPNAGSAGAPTGKTTTPWR